MFPRGRIVGRVVAAEVASSGETLCHAGHRPSTEKRGIMPVRPGIEHVVLKVRALDPSVAFYCRVFGYDERVERFGADRSQAFLSVPGSPHHHDLSLLQIRGDAVSPPRGSVGLFHFAVEVDTIEDLVEVKQRLEAEGAFTDQYDTGATASIYGRDLDGNRFEVLWNRPREAWGAYEHEAAARPLDLDAELARWGRR